MLLRIVCTNARSVMLGLTFPDDLIMSSCVAHKEPVECGRK